MSTEEIQSSCRVFFEMESRLLWARFESDGTLIDTSNELGALWSHLSEDSAITSIEDCLFFSRKDKSRFKRTWSEALEGNTCIESFPFLWAEGSVALSLCSFEPDGEEGKVKVAFEASNVPASTPSPTDLKLDRDSLSNALNSYSSGVLMLDDEKQILWVNEAFACMLGYDFDTLVGKKLFSLFRAKPESKSRVTALLKECSEGLRHREELTVYHRSGFPIWVEIEGCPVGFRRGVVSRYVLFFKNISSRKHQESLSEAAFDGMQQRIEHLEKNKLELSRSVKRKNVKLKGLEGEVEAKTAFLANMSHEIRTPMNAVIGFCDLLSSTKLKRDQEECVDAISSSGQLLIELINQVLDYSKIESGSLELYEERIDIEEVLLEIQAIMNGRAKMKQLDFTIERANFQVGSVLGDPIRIKQIFVNLVGNAIKFTRKGSVKIFASTVPSEIQGYAKLRFEIQDSGIGMNQEQLGGLFQPFKQLAFERGDEFEGTGLGLAICKRLCKAMNGDVWATSEESKGSTFCFELNLPAVDKDALKELRKDVEELKSPDSMEANSQEKLSLLVVDDNPNNRLITTKLAQHLGYEVKTVANGLKALEVMKKEPFVIVLMDIRMAPIDGIETTQRIRAGDAGKANEDVYVIALTAHALEGDREKCLDAGLNDYLAKPLSLEQLSHSLKKAEGAIFA